MDVLIVPTPCWEPAVPSTLFDPRRDNWIEHFDWQEFRIAALTPVGRALVEAFDLNHPRRQRIRQAERLFDLF